MLKSNDMPRVWRPGMFAALGATIANLVVYGLALAADVPFIVPGFGETDEPVRIPAGQVAAVTFLMLFLGTALAAFAERHGKVRLVQGLGVAVAVLSTGAPLSLDAAISTKLVLASMHVMTGGAFLLGLRRVRVAQPAGPTSATASAVTP